MGNFAKCTMAFEATERARLIQLIRDDSEFLQSLGLMDYSLLVGVSEPDAENDGSTFCVESGYRTSTVVQGTLRTLEDNDKHITAQTFQLGIIDYLQKWTPKKVAAHWLKKPTLGCCHEIDTEPPHLYSVRFYTYFNGKMAASDENEAPILN